MTPERLAEIEAVWAKVTPAPWFVQPVMGPDEEGCCLNQPTNLAWVSTNPKEGYLTVCGEAWDGDAIAIAAAPEHIAELLAHIRAQDATIARYEDGLTWGTTCENCARVLDTTHRNHERLEAENAALREVDRLTRRRLAEQAQKNGRPPHPDPLRTLGYWRERCAIVEAREKALREALRDIAFNTSTSVPPGEWPVHYYEHNVWRCIGIAADALHALASHRNSADDDGGGA